MQKIKLAIIGSGPTGWTAAVYAARAQLQPVVFAGYKVGGQLMWTSDVENFPGFPEGIRGPQLMSQMQAQAEKFGTVVEPKYVVAVDFSARPFKLWTSLPQGFDSLEDMLNKLSPEEVTQKMGELKQTEPDYEAESVIIATGAASIMLNIPGEDKLLGKGVSTCAVCDAAFYKDKNVFVVGGGDTAMEDTMALTKFAATVTVIHRRDQFKASKIMQDRVLNHPKVKVMWNSAVTEVVGEQKIEKIKVETKNGDQVQTQELPAEGLFLAIGHRPMTSIFKDQLSVDDHGYIVTRMSMSQNGLQLAGQNLDQNLVAYPTMTSVEGVFSGGDQVDVRYKQAITAAAQGCMSALDAEKWLENQA